MQNYSMNWVINSKMIVYFIEHYRDYSRDNNERLEFQDAVLNLYVSENYLILTPQLTKENCLYLNQIL